MTPPPHLSALTLTVDGAIARLTLHRPDRLNALSRVMLGEIIETCRWLGGRRDVKVVIVAGSGRAFSAGFDLEDFAGSSADPGETADLGRLAAEALTAVRQLTIASIHGHCVGGGLVLASACDLRVAAASATFAIPELDLGIPLTWGGIPRLVREFGPARTKELVLTCSTFGPELAASAGFLNRVVDDPQRAQVVDDLAAELARKPAFGLRVTKEQVNAAAEDMASTSRASGDRDVLVAALADPESRQAALDYLAARSRRAGDDPA